MSTSYPERHVVWSDDELSRTCAELPPWCAALLRFLRASGVRVGDALALRWEQVRSGPDGAVLQLRQAKTGLEVALPLSPSAVAALEASGRRDVGLVWPGETGAPRRLERVYRTVRAAMRRAGVTGRTLHDLRRSMATAAYNADVPPHLVAGLLGQRSTRMVPRYTRAEMDALRRAAAKAG